MSLFTLWHLCILLGGGVCGHKVGTKYKLRHCIEINLGTCFVSREKIGSLSLKGSMCGGLCARLCAPFLFIVISYCVAP